MQFLDPNVAFTINAVARIAPSLRLKRHAPGRIVFKIVFSGLAAALELIGGPGEFEFPGVTDADVSAWARTITLAYDPDVLPPHVWEDILALSEQPGGAGKIRDMMRDIARESTG